MEKMLKFKKTKVFGKIFVSLYPPWPRQSHTLVFNQSLSDYMISKINAAFVIKIFEKLLMYGEG